MQPPQLATSSSCWAPALSHVSVGWSSAKICSRLASMIALVAAGRPLHSPTFWRSSAITLALWGEALSSWGDGVRSRIVEIWDGHWMKNLVLMCFSTEVAFNGDQPCFVSDGDAVSPSVQQPA